MDAQCAAGLVCAPLSEATIEAYVASIAPDNPHGGTPLRTGDTVCQAGCRIDDAFHAPGEVDVFPNNCRSCQPEVSDSEWTVLADGQVCNAGTGDLCDPDEMCTGNTGTCPDDVIAGDTTVCRSGSADGCDPDEFCSGVADQACPADVYADATTVCREGSGDVCDPDELCPGQPGAACPVDAYAAEGTVCNPGSGDVCDPDETCAGTPGVACPADAYADSETVCNPGSGDLCDPDETCPGVADAACPSDSYQGTDVVCNPGTGDLCDPDEFCPGTPDAACPPDLYASSDTVCRAGSDLCDAAENCPGTPKVACPDDVLASAGTECRPPANSCDAPEVCDGESSACPEASDTLCDDGENCGADEDCSSGSCNGGICGDGNGSIGEACDSSVDCYEGNVCQDGTCLGTFSRFCARAGQCVTGLACDYDGTGECRVEVGGACVLDTDCAENASCNNGSCQLGINEVCTANSECASGNCNCPYLVPASAGDLTNFVCARPGVCKVSAGGACTQSNQCADEYRIDSRLSAGYERIREGLCPCTDISRYCVNDPEVPCSRPADCDDQDPSTVDVCGPPVCNSESTCTTGKLLLGAICEYDPEGSASILDPPDLGDSPNDLECQSQWCFKRAGGDNGPCTPGRICSPETGAGLAGENCSADSQCPGGTCLNACGRYDNPPDYFCCRDIEGVCSSDQDCCGGFALQQVGCGTPDDNGTRRCRELSDEGGPCDSNTDCVRFGNNGPLECLEIQEGSGTRVCTVPGQTPGLDKGEQCDPDPAVFNGYCQEGLTCLNCEQSGQGNVCADAVAPCCNNGDLDLACGATEEVYGTGFTTQVPDTCCNYTCTPAGDLGNCGGCGNDCSDLGGNACLSEGACTWTNFSTTVNSGAYQCEYAENPELCKDPDPDDGTSTRCVSTGIDTYECQTYTPIGSVEWESLCYSTGFEGSIDCTSNSQCSSCSESCTCVKGSAFGGLYSSGATCDCP